MGKVTGLGIIFYKTGTRKVAQHRVARHSFMLATAKRRLECDKAVGPMVGVQGEPCGGSGFLRTQCSGARWL